MLDSVNTKYSQIFPQRKCCFMFRVMRGRFRVLLGSWEDEEERVEVGEGEGLV